MQVTSISVEVAVVQNVGDYSSVRPSVRLEAALGQGDDVKIIAEQLRIRAEGVVYSIVDDAMEKHGRSPVYDTWSMRYNVFSADRHTFFPHQVRAQMFPNGVGESVLLLVPTAIGDIEHMHRIVHDKRFAEAVREFEAEAARVKVTLDSDINVVALLERNVTMVEISDLDQEDAPARLTSVLNLVRQWKAEGEETRARLDREREERMERSRRERDKSKSDSDF